MSRLDDTEQLIKHSKLKSRNNLWCSDRSSKEGVLENWHSVRHSFSPRDLRRLKTAFAPSVDHWHINRSISFISKALLNELIPATVVGILLSFTFSVFIKYLAARNSWIDLWRNTMVLVVSGLDIFDNWKRPERIILSARPSLWSLRFSRSTYTEFFKRASNANFPKTVISSLKAWRTFWLFNGGLSGFFKLMWQSKVSTNLSCSSSLDVGSFLTYLFFQIKQSIKRRRGISAKSQRFSSLR